MSKILSTAFLVSAFWGPALIAIVVNRVQPSLGTGLGVPLGILAGLVLGLVLTLIVFLVALRWPVLRPYYLVVILAGLAVGGLFPLADRGVFSVVS